MKQEEFTLEEFISEKYHNMLTEPEARFILDHGEKVLKDTLDSNSLVMSRMGTITSLASGYFIGLWGYIFSKLGDKISSPVMLSAIAGSILLIWVLSAVFMNMQPTGLYSPGAQPIYWFNDTVFDTEYTDRLLGIYVNEIHNLQLRIKENSKIVDERWQLYKWSLIGLLATPVIMFFTYGVVCLFNH